MHMRITSMIYSCQKMSINKDEWNRTTSRGVANLYITKCYTNVPLYKCKPKKLIYTNSLKSDKKKETQITLDMKSLSYRQTSNASTTRSKNQEGFKSDSDDCTKSCKGLTSKRRRYMNDLISSSLHLSCTNSYARAAISLARSSRPGILPSGDP